MRDKTVVNCILMKKGREIEPLWCICGSVNIEERYDRYFCTDCGKEQMDPYDRVDNWKVFAIIKKKTFGWKDHMKGDENCVT